MPLSSGAYTGTGQYFVRFRVGTPAQPFVLIADTGSDLTWVKCRGDGAAPSASPSHASSPSPSPSPPRVFRPSDSKTWTPIPCSSEACKLSIPFSLANCSSSTAACSYDYRYNDNSAARGVVGTDSATVALSGGRSDRKAKPQGGGAGGPAAYDGQGFEASDGVLSLGNGGTIIDSGASLTVLASPAYKAVVAALSQHLAGLPRVTMDPFDFCYNWTSRGGDLAVPVPKLSLQFAGSARLEPPAKSYEGAWPGVSVIGNILQQEHLWEFDITNRWLRFRQTRCTQ
uniref:Peptidase A1 domain-containing protein n=1 Tax=Oryza brachyantha TaxID=4533 RepID=J3M9L7_ORYBR